MSLVAPKDALTPNEQQQHPALSALYDFTAGMTSPENTALLVGTAGLGEIPGAAGAIIPRLVSAGFSAQTLYSAAKQSRPLADAIQAGDYSKAKYLLTSMGLNVGAAALGARHAVFGEGAVTGKTGKAEAAPIAEEVAHEPASPVGRNIAGEKLPPDVRITDSTATAEHILKQETSLAGSAGEPGVYVRPTPVSRGTNVRGSEVPLNSEEHAALEAEIGRPLTTQEANLMLRARAEQGMIGALGTPDEASAIREEHRSKLEKTAEEEGRYVKKPSETPPPTPAAPTKAPTLPGMENAVAEQKTAGNRPPESVEAAAGATELRPSEVARRIPTARVISENHIPIVSRDEILAQRIQTMVNNSAELARIGVDPSQVNTPADVTTLLNRVADHVKDNLDDSREIRAHLRHAEATGEGTQYVGGGFAWRSKRSGF